MKKYILIFTLLCTTQNIFTEDLFLEEFETEFFNETALPETPFSPIIITPQPKVFKLSDIPFYLKITAIGFYESKLKPAYYALIAYIKSFQTKK